MDTLSPGRVSPTRTFLILLGPLFLLWGISELWDREPPETWLIECPTNLDLLVANQGDLLSQGQSYRSCAAWPETVPNESVRWETDSFRCCALCRGTWETLCNLDQVESPGEAESCWSACAERNTQGDGSIDWPNLCCKECGATRSARCTVASDRDPAEVDSCFSKCTEEGPESQPASCWWDLGFEPGVSLRGKYEIVLTDSGFEATCNIRRRNGEVVEFVRIGIRGEPS